MATLWVVPALAVRIEADDFAPGAQVVDFEGDSAALPPNIGNVQFLREGTSGAASGWFAGGASEHNGELFGERALSGLAFRGNFSSVGVRFTNAVQAAGAWVSGLENSRFGHADAITISAFDAAGNLLDRVEMDLGLDAVFVGFSSLAGIARMEWTGDNTGYFGVDDLTAGQVAQVPEPGTALMLGLGLVGLGRVGRRKASRAGR